MSAVLLSAFLAFVALHACRSESLLKTVPRVENGVLDLRQWNFAKDGPVALDGRWEFYWHTLLKPDDFAGEHPPALNGLIKVPGIWNGYEVNGEKISGTGYATYRLKILLEKTDQELAFKFLDMAVAFSAYVNGKILLSVGIPGKTAESTRPQDKSTLFFGIFCLLIAVRSLVTGERYLIELFPDFNWEIHTKIAYLTFYTGVPVFAAYAGNIFPKEIPKYVIYVIVIVGALFSALVFFTPAKIYTNTAPAFQIFTLLVFCYGIYVLILAIYRKRQGARLYLAGFIVLVFAGVNDILYSNLLIETGYMIQMGLFVFIFSQALLLSLRFSQAFATVDSQRLTLQDTIKAYKNEIVERERTEEALRDSEEKYRQLVENAN